MIHASSLGGLATLAASLKSFDLLTLLSPGSVGSHDWRSLAPARHLQLSFHDIAEPAPDLIAPDDATMRAIVDFGRGIADRDILVHCWAGISRSSAAAYVIACDRNPGYESAIADELRSRSPVVTPNRLMVALADRQLDRGGRMIEAIARIGRGADAFEGAPYRLPLDWPIR
jgi:predicted protein tyrosine phosphatase